MRRRPMTSPAARLQTAVTAASNKVIPTPPSRNRQLSRRGEKSSSISEPPHGHRRADGVTLGPLGKAGPIEPLRTARGIDAACGIRRAALHLLDDARLV